MVNMILYLELTLNFSQVKECQKQREKNTKRKIAGVVNGFVKLKTSINLTAVVYVILMISQLKQTMEVPVKIGKV